MRSAAPQLPDTAAPRHFPARRCGQSATLHPIRTWEEMYRETLVTGVDFDAFWYESVFEGTACFFRWTGVPRATVLTLLEGEEPLHIECRAEGDRQLDVEEAAPIEVEVWRVLTGSSRSGSANPAH